MTEKDNLNEEFRILSLRSRQVIAHHRLKEDLQEGFGVGIPCKEHYQLVVSVSDCSNCIHIPIFNQLPKGKLPNHEQVLGYLLYCQKNGLNKKDGEYEVAKDLVLHWMSCNIYTIKPESVKCKIQKMANEYTRLRGYPKKKKGKAFWDNHSDFRLLLSSFMDIKVVANSRLRTLESLWGAVMSFDDNKFYESQKLVPSEGFCSTFMERRYEINELCKKVNFSNNYAYRNIKDNEHAENEVEILSEAEPSDTDSQNGYNLEPTAETYRYLYNPDVNNDTLDDMPARYRTVRMGMRSVREEIYVLFSTLSSKYHMSARQVEGAICEVSNKLFGRNFKPFSLNSPVDAYTLPAMTNMNRTGPYMEAMALSKIVEELMIDGAVVTYSYDGSAQSGVGSYVVQSVTINKKQRVLPTFGIITETRESLADMEETTLLMLSAASGHKYSAADIFENITFVMHDSTAHNLNVVECVAEKLEARTIPKTLLCNIHPLMNFQNKENEVFQEIQDSLGKEKIDNCFLVDVDFRNDNFILKSMKCLTNLINKDNSAKPWNRYNDFTMFIRPKKNLSISMKDHRFNRINDCALSLLYHMDDISLFLNKYQSILNEVAILDRGFLEMEVLKPIYAAVALLGLHITRPFFNLLVDPETNYSVLIGSFRQLYLEMTSIKPKELITKEHTFKFVKKEMFTVSLPKECLVENLITIASTYEGTVCTIMQLLLKKIAEGFSYQKGAIFGFGDHKDKDTKTVLKICDLNENEIILLDDVPTHNLQEERSVGQINYEISIRGKRNLETASRNVLLKKSIDLMNDRPSKLCKYRSVAKEINDIRMNWNERMMKLQEEGYSGKEALAITKENKKIKDLAFLKAQKIPGPFTTKEEIEKFMKSCKESISKNKRMYIEVRYARQTSLSLKESAKVFRLKKNGKNLDTMDYALNLSKYLETAKNNSTLTIGDLNNVLTGLKGASIAVTEVDNGLGLDDDNISGPSSTPESSPMDISTDNSVEFTQGEHVAAVWLDEENGQLQWYLGIVSEAVPTHAPVISYLYRSSVTDDKLWTFPESAQLISTPITQILTSGFSVKYECISIIKCVIEEKIIDRIKYLFDKYVAQQ